MLMMTELCGFGGIGTPPVVSSLAFVASSTSSGATTITLPSTIQAGDLLVLLDKAGGTPQPVDGTPSGWTEIRTDTVVGVPGIRASLYYKIAVGADASAVVTSGMTTVSSEGMVALVFRANIPIIAVAVSGSVGVASTGDPAAQSVVATSAVVPCVSVMEVGSTGAITGESYSGSGVDSTVAASTATHFSYKVWSTGSSPSTLTADQGDAGSNVTSGAFLSVS